MKTCSRCGEVKPDTSFRKYTKGDHLDSHCWHCRLQSRNESRRRYPHRTYADKILESRHRDDPIAFAYLTAKHIEAYVSNAIDRFERRKGIEAHPRLVAIRQLAAEIAKETLNEASNPANPRRRCELCGAEFEPVIRTQRFCCPLHGQRYRDREDVASGRNRERMRRRTPSR